MTATTSTNVRAGVPSWRVLARTCAAEWTRLRTVRATWWFAAAAAVLMLGLGTLLGFEAAADEPHLQGGPAWTTARFIVLPAQFVLLGLAVTASTWDYAGGGIVPVLQWTPRRGLLFAARWAVVGTAVAALGLLLATGAALAANATAGPALTLDGAAGVDTVATVSFVLACGVSIAVGLGFLLRNTAGAFVAMFLGMLVLPLLLPAFGDLTAAVARALPGSGSLFLLSRELPGMTTGSSVAVLLAWATGVPFLGWLRLTRSDAPR